MSLEKLVEAAWSIYRRYHDQPYFLKDSIPILFFGDLPRYKGSRFKVVTVGLNPSKEEFPRGDSFKRFRGMAKYFPFDGGSVDESFRQDYLSALNDYFSPETKYDWFDSSYEPVLNGMNCSYYSTDYGNTALHTDYCSPLATGADWGGLTGDQEMTLSKSGSDLWNELVRFLVPDAIIASIRRSLIDQILRRFPPVTKCSLVMSINRRKNGGSRKAYDVLKWNTALDGNPTVLVYAKAAQRPFGSVSVSDRREIGRQIVLELSDAQP